LNGHAVLEVTEVLLQRWNGCFVLVHVDFSVLFGIADKVFVNTIY